MHSPKNQLNSWIQEQDINAVQTKFEYNVDDILYPHMWTPRYVAHVVPRKGKQADLHYLSS